MTLEEMQETEHCTESHGRCDKASQKSDDDCFGGYAEPESEAHDL